MASPPPRSRAGWKRASTSGAVPPEREAALPIPRPRGTFPALSRFGRARQHHSDAAQSACANRGVSLRALTRVRAGAFLRCPIFQLPKGATMLLALALLLAHGEIVWPPHAPRLA